MNGGTILVTAVGEASGSRAAAAALVCAAASPEDFGLLIDLSDARPLRPSLIATDGARRLEERLAVHLPKASVASRGRMCLVALDAEGAELEQVGAALAVGREAVRVVHVPPTLFRPALEQLRASADAVLLRADLRRDRALTALTAADLIHRGLRVGVLKRPLGWLEARCAFAGVPSPSPPLPGRLLARLAEPRDVGA